MQTILFVLAGAALVAAFALRSLKPERASLAWGAFGVGVALALAAILVPQFGGGGSDATVEIVAPEEGATVPEDVTVQVRVEGGELASSASDAGGHIHIYIDDSLADMPYGDTTDISLEPGEHEITAEYVDATHVRLDPPVRDTVAVTVE